MQRGFTALPRRYPVLAALALALLAASAAPSAAAGTATSGATGTATSAAGTSASAPSLTLIRRAPTTTTVGGRHFRPSTRVHVTLRADGTATRVIRTGTAGSFSVTFAVPIAQCGGYVVTAVQGTRTVTLRSPAKPLCAPE